MSDYDFFLPDEMSNDLAEHGVWFDVSNRLGVELGSFKVAMFDEANPRVKAWSNRAMRQQDNLSDDAQKKRGLQFFVQCLLVDWKVKNSKSKDIPFDTKAATAYFSNPKSGVVLAQLLDYSKNPANYLPEGEEEAPEKN